MLKSSSGFRPLPRISLNVKHGQRSGQTFVRKRVSPKSSSHISHHPLYCIGCIGGILRPDGVGFPCPPRRDSTSTPASVSVVRLVRNRPALGSPIRRKEQERGFLGSQGRTAVRPSQKSPHGSVSPPSRRLPAGSRRYFPEEPLFLGRPAHSPLDTRVFVTRSDEKCRSVQQISTFNPESRLALRVRTSTSPRPTKRGTPPAHL